MPVATIAALFVYPVKGCRGIAVSRARVGARGLVAESPDSEAGDREWMVVDRDGRFVTQREHPRLALVETGLRPGTLVLTSAGMPPLPVPLAAPAPTPARDVVVWNSGVRAHDAGEAAARWISELLGAQMRLVRFDPAHRRLCNPDYAGTSGAHIAFADGYPVLVIGEASLADVNVRLAANGSAAVPMNRFRPNVVLAGLEPYDEDLLDTITAAGVTLRPVKPCIRCSVTTTDQDSAKVGTEPLATLAGYRTNAALAGVAFGMNAIVVEGEGRELTVGAGADCRFAF
jgi:uncharacterized protein YcbX